MSKQIVTAHFDAYAATWHDRLRQHPYAVRYDVVRRMVGDLAPKHVLDVGCGTGDYCRLFDPAGYVGYDISPEMIRQCRRLYPDRRFEVADGDAIPQPDASADLTLSIAVIEYYDDPQPHMRELARVTCPGGSVIVAVPNGDNRTRRPLNAFGRAIGRLKGKPWPPTKVGVWHNAHGLADMRRLGETASLRLVDHGYCSVRLVPHDLVNKMISQRTSDRRAWAWLVSWSATILVCRYLR